MLNTINLPEDLQAFAEGLVRTGKNASVEDVILDALKEKRRAVLIKVVAEMPYTWNQAVADGVIVDVTPLAKAAGFEIPVALTPTVHERLEPSERDARLGQSFESRLKEVLIRLYAHPAALKPILFDVILVENDEQHTIHLKAQMCLDATAEPVITIMFKHE